MAQEDHRAPEPKDGPPTRRDIAVLVVISILSVLLVVALIVRVFS